LSETKRPSQISKDSNQKTVWIKILNYINGRKPEQESKNEVEKRQADATVMAARWTMFLTIFTMVLAGIGIGTAYILYGQFDTSQKQLLEMQADAQIDQRAWLSVSDILPNEKGSGFKDFKITVTNTGKTPALKSTGWLGVTESPNDLDNTFIQFAKQNSTIQDITPIYGMIVPGVDFYLTTPPIPPDAIKRIKNGGNYYIFGTLIYSDIYGVKHWTEFCRNIGDKVTLSHFYSIGRHNQTDDIEH
jgi:hypothetical protein